MARLSNIGSRLSSMPSRVPMAPKLVDPFYQSAEWRGLVAQIKRERGPYCERCGSSHRVVGDHIRERKDGGADIDPSNIELLCHAHHQAKTAAARAARARGEAGVGGGRKSGRPKAP